MMRIPDKGKRRELQMGRRNQMTIVRTLAVGAIALAVFSVRAGSGMAAGALAVGEPDDVAKQGLSMYTEVNSETSERAQRLALEGCKKIGSPASKALCKVVSTFSNQCAAEAMDPQEGTPGFGWAVANTSEEAKKQALASCRGTAGPTRQDACVVGDKALWCDGSAK
jgi:hypothetical protein